MTNPTTPRPAPEAVEAALARLAKAKDRDIRHSLILGIPPAHELREPGANLYWSALDLAAEVEWLRHESQRHIDIGRKQAIDICALVGEIAELRTQLASYCGECGAKLQ